MILGAVARNGNALDGTEPHDCSSGGAGTRPWCAGCERGVESAPLTHRWEYRPNASNRVRLRQRVDREVGQLGLNEFETTNRARPRDDAPMVDAVRAEATRGQRL